MGDFYQDWGDGNDNDKEKYKDKDKDKMLKIPDAGECSDKLKSSQSLTVKQTQK